MEPDPQDEAMQQRVEQLRAEVAANRLKIAQLHQAIESGRVIGVAIGILMATEHITETEAFELLRSASQNSHRKVRLIAEEVMLTGLVPRSDH